MFRRFQDQFVIANPQLGLPNDTAAIALPWTDNFTDSNGTAPGAMWRISTAPGCTALIQSNKLRLSVDAVQYHSSYVKTADTMGSADIDLRLSMTLNAVAADAITEIKYRDKDGAAYVMEVGHFSGNWGVSSSTDYTQFMSGSHGGASGDVLHIRIQVIGNGHQVRTWLNGASEPTTWADTGTDSRHPDDGAVTIGIYNNAATSGYTDIDFVTVTDLTTTSVAWNLLASASDWVASGAMSSVTSPSFTATAGTVLVVAVQGYSSDDTTPVLSLTSSGLTLGTPTVTQTEHTFLASYTFVGGVIVVPVTGTGSGTVTVTITTTGTGDHGHGFSVVEIPDWSSATVAQIAEGTSAGASVTTTLGSAVTSGSVLITGTYSVGAAPTWPAAFDEVDTVAVGGHNAGFAIDPTGTAPLAGTWTVADWAFDSMAWTVELAEGSPAAGPVLKIRVGGAWVTATSIKVRSGGAWVDPGAVKVRSAGSWVTV